MEDSSYNHFSIIKKRGLNILSLFLVIILLTLGFLFPPQEKTQSAEEIEANLISQEIENHSFFIIGRNNLLPTVTPPHNQLKVVEHLKVIVTGYSSSPYETDDTPYITAAGTLVRDGIIANNFLPFGTKVRIPEIYGDKIFVVEDRMNRRKGYYHIDIWFPSYWEAKKFGVKRTYIEILED
ncbi:3D domain-containing protein [bacterium]|nr:3D domain-containing protein [bacterium]